MTIRQDHPTRFRRLAATAAACILGALAASACVPASVGPTTRPTIPFDADRVRVAHEMVFAPGATAPSPADALRLEAFVAQVGVQPGDTVRIIGYGMLGPRRSLGVRNQLAVLGIPSVSIAQQPEPQERVTVEVARTVFMPTACLIESQIRDPFTGAALPTPGCANAYNLARMVANPADLFSGRQPVGGADANPQVRAIDRYRTDGVIEPELLDGGQ